MSKKESEKTEKPRCEKCNSTLGYFRIKKKEFQCRSCGHITEMDEE